MSEGVISLMKTLPGSSHSSCACVVLITGWLGFTASLDGAQGGLDSSFGSGGKVTTVGGSGGASSLVYGLVVQPDGMIVAAGAGGGPSTGGDFVLARYLNTGALDSGFGSAGKVTTAVSSGSNYDEGRAVALQADGKILVAGYASNGTNDDFALVRYNTNGSLDTGFGTGGKVITAIRTKYEEAHAVAVQSDGKILVAGWSEDTSVNDYKDFVLVRYTTTGALDSTFGTSGKVITSIGSSNDYGNCMVVQGNGKIVVAGSAFNGSNNDFALVRYNTNGSLDTAFGVGGKAVFDFSGANEAANAMALQSDGKFVLAGSSTSGSSVSFVTIRVNTDGTIDTGFGSSGQVVTSMGNQGQSAFGVAVQPNGKILVAGYSYIVGDSDFVLLRLTSTGALDTGFGGTGKVVTPVGNGTDIAYCVALQNDGRIVVAGSAWSGVANNMALTRYMGEPAAPLVSLAPATGLGQNGVTINGSVNPRGYSTTAQFEYGLTAGYGSTAGITLSPADGASAQSVAATLTGLIPNTTYHYRLAASNAGGSVNTSDATFTTQPSTSQQDWRQLYFGTTSNTGNAADGADVDGDGLTNLLEWACGLNPTVSSPLPTPAQVVSSNVEFVYTRSVSAVNAGANFSVEWSDTLTGSDWQTSGVTQQVMSTVGDSQQVKATLSAGTNAHRFVHLRVSLP